MANATNLPRETFYITTAIAYPNGVPHIGHAYEAIATDTLARFARLDGKDVFFLTGTDEHGLKMVQTAEAEGLPTLEVATRNAARFKEMDERLNVSFDRFIRTTEEQHHRSSQEIWKRMADNGDIYLDSYAGWYSGRDEATNSTTGVALPDERDANWRYWPADVHIIGKDIIRFHAVYWPAFLMSAGIPVQKRVYAHGFLFSRGEKMSKSVGNVVDPFNLADQYRFAQARYFFLREVPFGQDGNYSHEAIVARINADLANDLGNLAQRSLSMIAKQYQGVLPEPGAFTDNDKAILAQADGMIALARSAMATQQIHQALNAVWAVVAEANRYFAGEAPWALAKTDPARQATVLYVTAEVVRQIAILAQPVMPESSAKLLDSLGIPQGERDFASLGGATRIKPGTVLPAPVPVFPRYVEPSAA